MQLLHPSTGRRPAAGLCRKLYRRRRTFGDLNDENSEVYQLIKNNKPYVLLESAGTKPNIFYIGLPENFEDKKWLQADFKNWQR